MPLQEISARSPGLLRDSPHVFVSRAIIGALDINLHLNGLADDSLWRAERVGAVQSSDRCRFEFGAPEYFVVTPSGPSRCQTRPSSGGGNVGKNRILGGSYKNSGGHSPHLETDPTWVDVLAAEVDGVGEDGVGLYRSSPLARPAPRPHTSAVLGR